MVEKCDITNLLKPQILSTTIAQTSKRGGFSDLRHTKRFDISLTRLKETPRGTIPQASKNKGEMKGVYRLLHNKNVNHKMMIKTVFDRLPAPINHPQNSVHLPRRLFLSDSTELDYTTKRSAANLGALTYKKRRGMILHNLLMVSNLGTSIELFDQNYIIREDKDFGQSAKRKYLPIEKKESIRWLNDFKKTQQYAQCSGIEAIFIADREADIMEIYDARSYKSMHFIIRSQHNRRLKGIKSKLYSHLKQQSDVGQYCINIPHSETLKIRQAQLAVRYCEVELELATTVKCKQGLESGLINAIEVYEINPPKDIKEPIRWVLLTSLPVKDFEDALQIVQYYVLRWIIERFHYLIKSGGAKVEDLNIEKPKPLKNAITLYSLAVMDIIKIKQLAENQPDICAYDAGITKKDCEVLFTFAHHQIDHRIYFDEEKPPSIWEFCRVLGRLGGFIPSKRQPIPGLKILSRAVEKFYAISLAFDVVLSMNS